LEGRIRDLIRELEGLKITKIWLKKEKFLFFPKELFIGFPTKPF